MKIKFKKLLLILLFLVIIAILLFLVFRPIDTLLLFPHLQLSVISVYLTLLIMLVALFGREIWDWYRKPELKLEFKEEYPFIVKAVTAEIGNMKEVICVRVKATNKGNTTAQRCEPRLEKIFDLTSKEIEIKEAFVKLILHWVGYPCAVNLAPKGGTIGWEIAPKEWITMDIAKDMDAFFDICLIDKNNKTINLVTSVEWPIFVNWQRDERKLRFWVSVYGENFTPKTKKDIVIDVEKIIEKFS
jgi:hypothetical protein